VAAPSKLGFVYVFDRETGEPVWPIEERSVRQTSMPGEKTSLTQPFPTKPPPYAGQGSADDELIDFTPELRAEAIELLKGFTRGPLFTPPSLTDSSLNQGTIQRPSLGGATNWAGGAVDPETAILYVPSRDGFTVTRFYTPKDRNGETVRFTHGGRGGARPQGPQGLPVFKPPYSRMTAINLNRGDHQWMKPAGVGSETIRNHPALRGLELPPLGGERRGGPIVTKTLMICTKSPGRGPAASDDDSALLAFDKATGSLVGEVPLPGRPIGTPMTYMIDGRQYIALAVSGPIPKLVAFALP
jgi:quinoprotein glucose dehydrogenase